MRQPACVRRVNASPRVDEPVAEHQLVELARLRLVDVRHQVGGEPLDQGFEGLLALDARQRGAEAPGRSSSPPAPGTPCENDPPRLTPTMGRGRGWAVRPSP